MREAKKFKVLKGFTVFFTVGVILALLFYFVFGSKGTQGGILNLLLNADSTLTAETLDEWADWGILAACIMGILQLIFMSCAFSAAKKAIHKGRARTVQASVYMSTPKEEKHMKKEALKASKKDAKMKTKQERLAAKKAKHDAKIAKKEAKHVKAEEKAVKKVAPAKVEAPVVEHRAKSNRIDDILNGMK